MKKRILIVISAFLILSLAITTISLLCPKNKTEIINSAELAVKITEEIFSDKYPDYTYDEYNKFKAADQGDYWCVIFDVEHYFKKEMKEQNGSIDSQTWFEIHIRKDGKILDMTDLCGRSLLGKKKIDFFADHKNIPIQ